MKEGWKMVKLKDISENLDYKRIPITKGLRTIGKFPYYGASGIVDYVSDYIFDDNLLLISEDGANLLARTTPIAFSVSGKIWVNNHAHVLKFQNLCTQKIVEYFIAGFNITPYVTGMAQPKLNQKSLDKIEIPLPPLEEQHRIVGILDAAFAKIDALKKNAEENLKNAKAFYDKLLIEKFSHKEGWIKSTLQDECFKITDGTHQTPKYFESGHIFLSSGNVTNRKIDWDNIKFIDEQQHQEMQKRVSPKINDILLAKNGTTGVAALVDRDVDFDIYVSLALLRTLGRITPQYMYYFVNSPIAKSQFNKRLKGAGVPNLHLTEIRQVEISYSKDIEKQNEIVKTIENIDEKCRRLEQVAQQTIRECDALKQSILRQAFSGEL